MQIPLCFPEKITSGPADMGVMEADPECIGVNGELRAGGTMPDEGVEKKNVFFLSVFFLY